jgi:ligand-binding sensor domain-containing protein
MPFNYKLTFFGFIQLICIWFVTRECLAQADSFSTSSRGVSSNYMVEVWDNTNGLPQNVVFALEKDNHGYLWAATEEGLARLDGYSSKVFDQENYPIMQEQTYYTFYKSPAGIWATSDRSIALLDKNVRKIIDCSTITENTWLRAVTEIGEDNLLIGTDAGEIHEWKNNSLKKLDYWLPEFSLEIQSFFLINPSRLLVGTTRGLYEIDLKSRKNRLISPNTFSAQKVFGTLDFLLVYSPDLGIFRLKEDFQMENIIPSSQIKDINPSSLTIDSEKKIWAGSLEKGLVLIENGKLSRFTYPELKNYTVRKIIKEDDNLYLGTLGKGLILIKPARVSQLDFGAINNQNIKAIYQSKDSSVWIGTKANGLHQIKNGKIQSWTMEDGLIQNGNTSIASRDGKIYFGSSTGISVIDIQSRKVIDKITEEEGLLNNYVQAIFKDSKGWLWILTRKGGLHYLDTEGHLQTVKLPKEFTYTRFVSVLELRNKQILIGSMNDGIFRIENGIFVQNQALSLPPGENVVYCMYEDRDGELWFGTHGGLLLLKDGKFKTLKKINGLKSKTVFSITDDRNLGIWISNNFGVQYFSYSQLQNFKNSEDEKLLISSTLYDQRLGLPNSETNGLIFPAAIQDFSGKIWIPTVDGVGIIDPSAISQSPKKTVNFNWDELRFGEQKSPIENQVEIPEGVRFHLT